MAAPDSRPVKEAEDNHVGARTVADARWMAELLCLRMDKHEWHGADPYDGLSTPLAGLAHRPLVRQALQQAVRRSPINMRAALRIPGHRMAAATGLAATAAFRLAAAPFWSDMLDRLGRWTAQRQFSSGLFRGLWGYEFDVQTRWGFYAAGSPNIVATSFAAHGCLDAQSVEPVQLQWLGSGLMRHFWRDRFFAYTAESDVLIHNANLLGAELAARLSELDQLSATLRSSLRAAAADSAHTTLAHQRADGSWPYGEDPRLGWVDGFHTAYNLLSLESLIPISDDSARPALQSGARYYFEHLFRDGIPLYYADRPGGPSDINNVATGLRAAVWGAHRGYAPHQLPAQVLEHLVAVFWDPAGFFRASNRITPGHRLNYPRWGAAPALDALSSLISWNHERTAA